MLGKRVRHRVPDREGADDGSCIQEGDAGVASSGAVGVGRKRLLPQRFDRTNKTRYKRSKQHEKRWARQLGGRRVPGSGSIRTSRWSKRTAGGDVRTPDFYIEHKRTDRASLGVKREWLERISQEAECRGLTPAVGLTFEGRFGAENDWVAVPLSFLRRLMDRVKNPSAKEET